MDILTPDPTSVYKYYDRNNLLLYVGITRRGTQRNREHDATKIWWRFVVRQEVEHHPHRMAALQREKHLIRKFRPPFNKQHNPFHAETSALYLACQSTGQISLTSRPARQLLMELRHKLPLLHIGNEGTSAFFASDPDHADLAAAVRWEKRVILRAPKKVSTLVNVETQGAQSVFEFRSDKRPPYVRDVSMSLRAHQRPFAIVVHEAIGTLAPEAVA